MMEAPPQAEVLALVRRALAEDVGRGDLTAELVPATRSARGVVVGREAAVVCGRLWFDAVFAELDPAVRVSWLVDEGARVDAGAEWCRLEGPARALLTGERTALNFLQTLSGTATATRRHVEALGGTRTRLLDTRKTLPGLRVAQKYAVRCGGGLNHRFGLYDGILIKENHILACGSIAAAVAAARAAHPGVEVEVEVEDEAELEQAIAAGADRVLLDNFDHARLAAAVRLAAGRVPLEASGGYRLEDLPAVAASGVDFVSVGGLTKHVRAVDLSMRLAIAGGGD